MNTKKQTVWLVSMLSLMVVLSAYYLFTQDLDDADKLTESGTPVQNVTEATGEGGLVVNGEAANGEELAARNQEVLEQLEREGFVAGGLFSELLAKRELQNKAEEERIMAIIADVSNDVEAATAAWSEMDQLEDKNSRIQELESALMEQYKMALISQENDRYKVVVTSQKLEKSEAAGIIEQVLKGLEVKPSQVTVQYVQEP
ncbi:hypothetical protein A7K91_23285 [Paenibacillus oryzae]|uniref:SpoIIIAH-like family protein n=1 Tax=Paenibacillus oryzae TaxID=1844972 RepID=A0A1A5YBR9_9BACL|nr:SpoIIIAH-like family protein [Paenibacillus oryzae]OBR63041.1 hypothetical protein A7K91_23285 [Paenibacillus oryzae]